MHHKHPLRQTANDRHFPSSFKIKYSSKLTAVNLEEYLWGMKWVEFHSPNISLPVVKRRIGVELLEMLDLAGIFLSRGGWGLLNRNCYPSQRTYYNATRRLRNRGLVASRSVGGKTPVLHLTDEGREYLPDCFRPEKSWNRKWNGIWYLFVYDVPEVDRKYRNVLRLFLKRLHLGCLQQSVWVTPNDIRPEYDDLAEAAGVNSFAYLFESRTVLGLPARRVVESAWDFDLLYEIQNHYCEVFGENLVRLEGGAADAEHLAQLLRNALCAYRSAFELDPLLPRSLWPADYRGEQVYFLHRKMVAAIATQLNKCSSELTAVNLEE